MTEHPSLPQLRQTICSLAETLTTSAREIIRHFQVLKSARAARLMMDAPGLFFPDLSLYVISKAGAHRGHTAMQNLVGPHLPPEGNRVYGFVLYPESYVRSCLDRLLRKSVRTVSPEMRLSIENNFNAKHHHGCDLTDSQVMHDLVGLMRRELGLPPL
ncbi:MAG: hypothetical protein AB1568_00075 [Thermodesulfobacteriota bacterium]